MANRGNPYGGTPGVRIVDLRNKPGGVNASHLGGGYGGPSQASYELTELRARVHTYEAELERLATEAMGVATIVEIRRAESDDADARMTISLGPGGVVDVVACPGARVGDRVLVTRNTMQAVEVVRDDVPAGVVVSVDRQDGVIVQAEVQGMARAFRAAPGKAYGKGERAIVDHGMTFVIGTLGMPPQQFSFSPKVRVAWDDVGGQAEAKAALREAIELPFAHPELFADYGKQPSAGVMLSGASGTGKTLLAKAAATAIAKAHGKSAADGFAYVKGPELLHPYIGKSEAAIRQVFAAAREHKARHGYPAVIFLDECDALLGVRDHTSKISMNATTVPQFLAEMDGLDDKAAILILATNRPDMIDPAVTRDGRIDRRVRVGRPSKHDAAQIFAIHLRRRPVADLDRGDADYQRDLDRVADGSVADLWADRHVVRTVAMPDGARAFCLRDFVSGAMIAGIVEQASTFAMQRDLTAGVRAPSGIGHDDLARAIERTVASLRDTNHSEVVLEALREAGQGGQGESP